MESSNNDAKYSVDIGGIFDGIFGRTGIKCYSGIHGRCATKIPVFKTVLKLFTMYRIQNSKLKVINKFEQIYVQAVVVLFSRVFRQIRFGPRSNVVYANKKLCRVVKFIIWLNLNTLFIIQWFWILTEVCKYFCLTEYLAKLFLIFSLKLREQYITKELEDCWQLWNVSYRDIPD